MLLNVQPGFALVSHFGDGASGLAGIAAELGCPVSSATTCGTLEAVTWGLAALDSGNTVLMSAVTSRSGRDVSAEEVGQLLRRDSIEWLREMLPPFGAVCLFGRTVKFAVDFLGFRQLYIARGSEFVAVSTSARILARLIGSRLNRDALALQSMLGWQVGNRTLFTDVETVQPGALYEIVDGSVTVQRLDTTPPPLEDLEYAVGLAAERLREYMNCYLDEHPDAVLQLTGGQDSRILLSAVPSTRRADLRAATLEVPGSEDAEIARRLATKYGLRHTVGTMAGLDSISPGDAFELCLSAAVRLDCMADPLALATLTLAEQKFDQGARISGLGGECARGFYYVAPALSLAVTRRRVRQLADWRMFANESVRSDSLEPAFAAWATDVAHATVWSEMRGGPDMLIAGDEFYFWQRMRRWAGLTDTAVCFDRSVTNPMLDSCFLDISRGMPPRLKARSVFLARLQMRLDSELGRIPLDGRPAPIAYAQRSGRATVARNVALGRAAVRKVGQRIGGSGRPPAGGDQIAVKAIEGWRERTTIDAVAGLGIFRSDWLEQVHSGMISADPATTALLFNLHVAAQVCDTKVGC